MDVQRALDLHSLFADERIRALQEYRQPMTITLFEEDVALLMEYFTLTYGIFPSAQPDKSVCQFAGVPYQVVQRF